MPSDLISFHVCIYLILICLLCHQNSLTTNLTPLISYFFDLQRRKEAWHGFYASISCVHYFYLYSPNLTAPALIVFEI